MNGCPYSVVRVKFQILYARNCMKSKHIWGPVVSEFAWNLYGNAATLGQNCQFSRLQQTNLLAYMFCLGIKNHHFSATSWCMSNRVSFQNQATDTCCQESRHESLILIGSQNLYFDAFGSLYLSFPKKLRYTIVIYGKIQSYRNCKIQGWSCTRDQGVYFFINILATWQGELRTYSTVAQPSVWDNYLGLTLI